MQYQITHIVPDGSDPGRRIDAVYGPTCGLLPEDSAIAMIDAGDGFYTSVYGVTAAVYVAGTWLTGRFLTTSPDGFGPNNLCQLPVFRG